MKSIRTLVTRLSICTPLAAALLLHAPAIEAQDCPNTTPPTRNASNSSSTSNGRSSRTSGNGVLNVLNTTESQIGDINAQLNLMRSDAEGVLVEIERTDEQIKTLQDERDQRIREVRRLMKMSGDRKQEIKEALSQELALNALRSNVVTRQETVNYWHDFAQHDLAQNQGYVALQDEVQRTQKMFDEAVKNDDQLNLKRHNMRLNSLRPQLAEFTEYLLNRDERYRAAQARLSDAKTQYNQAYRRLSEAMASDEQLNALLTDLTETRGEVGNANIEKRDAEKERLGRLALLKRMDDKAQQLNRQLGPLEQRREQFAAAVDNHRENGDYDDDNDFNDDNNNQSGSRDGNDNNNGGNYQSGQSGDFQGNSGGGNND